MNAADIALWIWLSPVLVLFAGALVLIAAAVTVGVDRFWRRWRDLPSTWARRTVMRRWWRRHRMAILALVVTVAWFVGGFLVVVYLNGATA